MHNCNSFNSKMVRFKGRDDRGRMDDHPVSIPKWYDLKLEAFQREIEGLEMFQFQNGTI